MISFFFLKEKGVGVFGFTILVIFQIGFSVSAFKKSGFSVWVIITVALCLLRSYLRKKKIKHSYVWRNAGWELR